MELFTDENLRLTYGGRVGFLKRTEGPAGAEQAPLRLSKVGT